MNLGWIISGPGSTWVNKNLQLVRCPPTDAHVFHESPSTVLGHLDYRTHYDYKFRVHQIRTEFVGTWEKGGWKK